jgi:hypothetical protein
MVASPSVQPRLAHQFAEEAEIDVATEELRLLSPCVPQLRADGASGAVHVEPGEMARFLVALRPERDEPRDRVEFDLLQPLLRGEITDAIEGSAMWLFLYFPARGSI